MGKTVKRIIQGRGNAPIAVKTKLLSDFEVATMVTKGNTFEAELLMARVRDGKPFNGQYFTDKNKAIQEQKKQELEEDEEYTNN